MTILEAAIGWIAPPQCVTCGREGSALCVACATSGIVLYGQHCWLCNRASPGGRTCPKCRTGGSPRFVWITTNYDGTARDLIKVYKFGHQRAAARSLSQLMVETLHDFNNPAELAKLNYLVVPVPTATSRIRQRGFDHSALLARTVGRQLGAECANGLGRLGQTRQLGAKRSDRLSQPKGNYSVRLPQAIKGRNILLIDDVVTTGATLKAVTKVLRAAGAKRVDALVFAKRL